MSRQAPSRVAFLVPAVVCLAIAATMTVQLSRGMNEGFYWTPAESQPTLEQARDRVEVHVKGELLQRYAERGELLLGPSGDVVDPDELKIRLNNFDQVARAQLILLTAAVTGAVVLLVVGFMVPGRSAGPLDNS